MANWKQLKIELATPANLGKLCRDSAIALDHKSDCPKTAKHKGIITIYIFIGLIENLSIKRKYQLKLL